MKTQTFAQSFGDVHRLSGTDIKPLGAKLGKLMEEVGELAECVNIHQGYITHKVMKEPLSGEVADVVQCALAILVDAHPELSKKQVLELFLSEFERKNSKWATVQSGDQARIAAQAQEDETASETAKPTGESHDITQRCMKIIQEQLGLARSDVVRDARLVEDLGADSLDLVELCMAVEDEFEFEISDRDAERLFTVQHVISYVNTRFGVPDDEYGKYSAEEEEEVIHEMDTMRATAIGRKSSIEQTTHYDPAADYTERTGRHLTLEERMQERSRFNNKG